MRSRATKGSESCGGDWTGVRGGVERREEKEDLRVQAVCVDIQKFCEVRGSKLMEGFAGEAQDFKDNMEVSWKPAKQFEDWGDTMREICGLYVIVLEQERVFR